MPTTTSTTRPTTRRPAPPWSRRPPTCWTTADYLDAIAGDGPPASLVGPAAPSPWDPPLADAMADVGRIIYEEDVLEPLLADLAR